MSRVLVYQANGVQGAASVRSVLQAGYVTRALIRDPSRAEHFISSGVEVAVADLNDREALLRAHESFDHVILQIPAYTDAFVARAIGNAVFAMESARIKSAVIKMANPTPTQYEPDSGFSASLIVLERLHSAVVPYSVVEPTMYLDTFLKPNLRHEISQDRVIDLPLPHDLRIAWTTADDAARMAVRLLKAGSCGMTLRCAGDVALDGNELAAAFSAALGHGMKFRSTDLDVFQRDIESVIGPLAAAPIVSKFRFLSRYPEEANRMLSTSAKTEDIPVGAVPTRVQEWIRSNLAQFGAQAPAGSHEGL